MIIQLYRLYSCTDCYKIHINSDQVPSVDYSYIPMRNDLTQYFHGVLVSGSQISQWGRRSQATITWDMLGLTAMLGQTRSPCCEKSTVSSYERESMSKFIYQQNTYEMPRTQRTTGNVFPFGELGITQSEATVLVTSSLTESLFQ